MRGLVVVLLCLASPAFAGDRWLSSGPAAGTGFRCSASSPTNCGFELRLAYDFVFGDAFAVLGAGPLAGTTEVVGEFGADVGTPHFKVVRWANGTRAFTLAGRVGLAVALIGGANQPGTRYSLLNDYALIATVGVARRVSLFARIDFVLSDYLGNTASSSMLRGGCCGYSLGVLVGALFPLFER